MSTTLQRRPTDQADSGGAAARLAVTRWAWRLFRREWRRQLLILCLVTVAVAATILGAAIATNGQPVAAASFGTAGFQLNLPGSDPELTADIAAIRKHFGTIDVIENQTVSTGLVGGAQLRAQDPRVGYGAAMLSLVAGSYPSGRDDVALTSQLADSLNLKLGDSWTVAGRSLRIVGYVENPENLFDSFALVLPGQLTTPNNVTVLLDASAADADHFRTSQGLAPSPPPVPGVSPALLVLAIAIVGLIFVGLVAVAGFTVLAQRRLRGLGMLSALGATDRNIRLVIVANGALVGVLGAVVGAVVGLGVWIGYAPRLATSAGHRIAWTNLPWWLVAAVMMCAVLTTSLAARRPARAVAAIPVVAALSGRPAPAKGLHRSAIPGAVLLIVGVGLLVLSGGLGSDGSLKALGGLLACALGLLFLAPLGIALLGMRVGRAPIGFRIAVRVLGRYRARSGAALAASSFAVFIAMVVILITTGRFADSVDYTGPNLRADQLVVYASPDGPVNGAQATPADRQTAVRDIETAVGSEKVLSLDSTDATLIQFSGGLQRGGPGTIYVATPSLLAYYGIDARSIDPAAMLITSRSGLKSTAGLQLQYGEPGPAGGSGPAVGSGPVGEYGPAAGQALTNPQIQTVSALPTDTSAPNLLVTPYAVNRLKLKVTTSAAWLVQTADPLTAARINTARQAAAGARMTIETQSDQPSLDQLRNYATIAGILLALGVLAMTVGLIRSETGSELRSLAATGAAGVTRRTIAASTAGVLGLLAGTLGTAVAYLSTAAYFRSELSERMGNPPVLDLLIVLLGLPIVAAVGGWIFAGRQPPNIAHQPIE